MDEKRLELPSAMPSPSSKSRLFPRRRFIAMTLLLLAAFYFFLPLQGQLVDPIWAMSQKHDFSIAEGKVKLEAHIMSKCPDARDCLRDMVVPAMEQISDLVEFKTYFIGE
jgi:hypothetical protein